LGDGRAAEPTLWPPAGLEGVEAQCVATDVGDLWLPTSDEVIRPFLLRRGHWEREEAALLRALVRRGTRFLDVGANVGYFSLLAARNAPEVSVDAVEPHPVVSRLLGLNLWAGRVAHRRWELALSAGDRLAVLSTSPTNAGDTRTRTDGMAGTVSGLVVPACAGDELFAGRAFDVVKIDVQGFEPDVVAGLTQVIQRSTNIRIVAEFWPTALREKGLDPQEVLESYRRWGLRVAVQVRGRVQRLPTPDVLSICDSAGPDGQVNLLLTREADDPRLVSL
jgi:FkbM family methyltransferase